MWNVYYDLWIHRLIYLVFLIFLIGPILLTFPCDVNIVITSQCSLRYCRSKSRLLFWIPFYQKSSKPSMFSPPCFQYAPNMLKCLTVIWEMFMWKLCSQDLSHISSSQHSLHVPYSLHVPLDLYNRSVHCNVLLTQEKIGQQEMSKIVGGKGQFKAVLCDDFLRWSWKLWNKWPDITFENKK